MYKSKEKRKENSREYRKRNLEKVRAHDRERYKKNPEKKIAYSIEWQRKNPERLKNQRLLRNYGFSMKKYNALLEEQKGLCAVCFSLPNKRRLAVDHNHKNGKVRGLLCYNCNIGIGFFKEDILVLENAINYLTR